MKKTFPLELPGKARPRVLDGVKNDVRKYVKRERRKALPEGFSTWTFRCKVGPHGDDALECDLAEVTARIDEIANTGGPKVYVEIVAEPGHRIPPEPAAPPHP